MQAINYLNYTNLIYCNMRFLFIICAIVFINFEIIIAFYSINYYVPSSSSSSDQSNQFNNNPLIITKTLTFLEAPDFIQVADIYNRLSGRSPLLIEGFILVKYKILFDIFEFFYFF